MVRRGAVSARRQTRTGAAVLGLAGLVVSAAGLAVTTAGPAAARTTAAGTTAVAAGTARTVRQPAPPVSARAFPVEPAGRAPVDGDGLIPNPATPAGERIAPPRSCTITFRSARGATSASVNAWIAAHQNSLAGRTVVCLAGRFTRPVHVWGKTSRALLEIAPAPRATATLDLGVARPADTDPDQFWSDAGGVSLVDSRSVEIYGLTVENYHYDGPGESPAGIYVTVRSDRPHLSACFRRGGGCGDIYLIRNTVRDIANTADENHADRAVCGNGGVDAYGIAVIAAGSRTSPALQHLVIEGNTVTGTRTGQSETVTINGDVTDFLAARNVIRNADNIGLDTIGWETGSAQARHGLVTGNTVYNVDTWSNAAYGQWRHGRCAALPENAAGLYDDGASYIWLRSNTVWNTDQGINLDVETNGKETDHLLVSGNTVHNGPGTSASDPSAGSNPPGRGGRSAVAGHDPFALYIDAFGAGASIRDVYVHDNTFQNQSQHFLTPASGMPVVDLGGRWSDVQVWHNTIAGRGPADRYNPLLEVDSQPRGGRNAIDCNDYRDLSRSPRTVNGNFALPHDDWLSLAAWQARNGHGWDAHSRVGAFAPACGAARSGPAAPGIGAPRRHGRLRITGRLRDDGAVAAAGLGWRPGRLPSGDHLLSFEVGYAWRACDQAGRRCVTGAGTTATPFAERRYQVGHADTGRRLRVTETATEVVATSRAGSGFTVVRASASATARRVAGAYPAGRAPASTLVNGTPEARTGSDAEWFQVSAPHYRTTAGPARQWYRVDSGRWRPLGASRDFYAGALRPGRHRIAVRTADRAGATVLRFGWRVTPLPAPVACRPARRCWYPQHLGANDRPMRWDWQIGRAAPLERTGARAVDVYDLDGFLTSRAELRALHTRWPAATLRHPRAICYLDLAWEDYRPDASPGRYFPADTLGDVYYGYPEERWVDFRQLDALRPMLDERLAMCARKGFDAVELDDIDSFDPPSQTGFRLTPGDAQNFLAYALNQVHRDGMTALWKNSPYLSWWGRRYADGAIVEECYVYHMCFASSLRGSRQYGITCTALSGRTPCGWDDFSTDKTARQPTGKWVGEAEYSADHYVCNPGQRCPAPRRFATFCRLVWAPAYGFAAVKFDVDLDGRMFFPCPRGR